MDLGRDLVAVLAYHCSYLCLQSNIRVIGILAYLAVVGAARLPFRGLDEIIGKEQQ